MNNRINENDIEELQLYTQMVIDQFFPKGKCKERGRALVMYAEMLIRIKNNFRIIPKTDSPEEWVTTYEEKGFVDDKTYTNLKLKWKKDK